MTCHFQCSKDIEAWCWSDPRPAERTDDLSGRERFAEFRIGGLPAREQPRTWCNPAAIAAGTPGARDPVGGAHVNQSEHWLCRRQGRATDQPVVSGHRHIREQPQLIWSCRCSTATNTPRPAMATPGRSRGTATPRTSAASGATVTLLGRSSLTTPRPVSTPMLSTATWRT